MTTATVAIDVARQHRRGRLYVGLAAVAWSTAGLFQRELTVDLATQLAGRAFFAVIGIVAFVAVAEHGRVVQAFREIGRAGLAVAALMAISSGAFIAALNYTSVANVLFMQALAPVLAAVFGTFAGEPVARRTWVAMAVAVAGVALMVGGPSHPSVAGFSLSLLMAVSFAGTIVITRHQRQVSMAPATCLSQAAVFVCAAPFASAGSIGWKDLTLLEIVLGPLWVWIALGEQPSATTLAGGAIVLGAVVIQAIGEPEEPSVPPP